MNNTYSQSCKIPFAIKFSERTVNSIDISWSDTNINPEGWEIELIKKGELRIGLPSTPVITQKHYTFTNLIPSTAYEIYIRAVCTSTSFSSWNVAIPFTTVLEIPTACQVNVLLKDNATETLLLDVKEQGILGVDIFLESIDLIIAHDWPADLKIILESPQGQQLILSNHNGTVFDDFGDIDDLTCDKVSSIAPGACFNLKDRKPPFIGSFKPDGDIELWKPDTLSRGIWKLIVTDRAINDIGTLKYLNIKFNNEKCLVPQDLYVRESNFNTMTLGWNALASCNTVKITLKTDGIPAHIIFAECSEESYTFENLLPNTEFEATITGICSDFSQSPESCSLKASTTCESVSFSDNFDNQPVCAEGCSSTCEILNSIWFNPIDDSNQDWIVWKDGTDTENTGPSGDVNGTGNYLYIENNPLICPTERFVILQSKCINVLSNSSSCDMSFYYHMFGADITYLHLELSTDNGENWQRLWIAEGNQGDVWKRVTLSLEEFAGKTAIFRFVSQTSNGALSDIALDQIEFYKSSPVEQLTTYYPDKDNDGYGTNEGKTEICSSDLPIGYSRISGDCDDNNGNIHPGVDEIPCNALDENCNGDEDDQSEFNPLLYSYIKQNASCNGSKDGLVSLSISGGTPPYTILWNNNKTGQQIDSLPPGVYFANITDAGGCIIKTDFFEIGSSTILHIISPSSSQPSCNGINNGSINIEHSSENPPYLYQWSNGSNTKNLTDIGEGIYSVTVTDNRKCTAEFNNINLTAKPSVTSDIKNIRHPLCPSQNTGMIELITFNGLPPYTYSWNTGDTTAFITSLSAGNYTSTITDSNGCIYIKQTSILSPSPLVGNILNTESVRCYGENNGSIKTNISGGRPPYSYLWNNFSLTDDIFNLTAGTYTLTVTDANGCKLTLPPIQINQPAIFEIMTDSIIPASCIFGKNGGVSIHTSGGNGDYNYAWNHTNISLPYFSDLMSGNYSVTAYDKLGCKASIPNIFIPYINVPVEITVDVLQENTCFNEMKGKVSSQLANGLPPFDYNWSHGIQYFKSNTTDTISSLPAGNYTLTITDSSGCVGVSNTVTLAERETFNYSVAEIINNNCNTDSTGKIKVFVSGGVSPIGILWNGGLYSGKEINHLPNGVYTGVIQEANGCRIDITPIIISSVSDIILTATIKNDSDQTSSGEICLTPSGGQAPYQINWNIPGDHSNCLDNLAQGIYQTTVTDQLNCTSNQTFIIQNISFIIEQSNENIRIFPNPAENLINIISDDNIQKIKLSDTKGSLIETIKILNKSTTESIDISQLPRGLYFLEVELFTISKRFKLIKL